MLTSSSFVALTTTFVKCKTDIVAENKKYNIAYASKDLMDTIEPYNDESKSPPRHSEP